MLIVKYLYSIAIYNEITSEVIQSFEFDIPINSFVLNSNKTKLAFSLTDGEIRIYSLTSFQLLNKFYSGQVIRSICFNDKDTRLAVLHNNGIDIWHIKFRIKIHSFQFNDEDNDSNNDCVSVYFNKDNSKVIAAFISGLIISIDIETTTLIRNDDSDSITTMCLNSDKSIIICSDDDDDDYIKVFDSNTLELLKQFKLENNSFFLPGLFMSNNKFIINCVDKFYLVDIITEESTFLFSQTTNYIKSATLSTDETKLFVSSGNKIKTYSLETFELIGTMNCDYECVILYVDL